MLSIYAPYVENTVVSLEYEPPSLTEFTERFERFTSRFAWLVLLRDGKAAGYSYAHRFHERAAYDWSAECTIYLDSHSQGKGLGRALYTCLLDILKLQGYINAVGLICVPNDKSEALHMSLGFKQAGTIPGAGYKFGMWRNIAWYSRSLAPHSQSPAPPLPIAAVSGASEFQEIITRCEKMMNGAL